MTIRLPASKQRCCFGHIDGGLPITLGVLSDGNLAIAVQDARTAAREVPMNGSTPVSLSVLESILKQVRAKYGGFRIELLADERLDCVRLAPVVAVLRRQPPDIAAFRLADFDLIYFSPLPSTNGTTVTIRVSKVGANIQGQVMELAKALETIKKLRSLGSETEYDVWPADGTAFRDLIPVLAALHRESNHGGVHLRFANDEARKPEAQQGGGHVR